jgi:hypothetical protein
MERLRTFIKEILSTPPTKKDCNCGCHSCEDVGNPGVVLNESIVPKQDYYRRICVITWINNYHLLKTRSDMVHNLS